ncbi:glutaminyl-peptide cyclotransferase, partial [Chryseobacterium taichungense]
TKGSDDVLNGIAFKGDNMLVTGKNWPKIYEVAVK